jgi:hypothetical protein
MSEAPPAPIIQTGQKGKKEAPVSRVARGAEGLQVSTMIYCIHIPRTMNRADEWLGIFRSVTEFEDPNVG